MKRHIKHFILAILLFDLTCCNSQKQDGAKTTDISCGRINPHFIDHYRDTSLQDYIYRTYPDLRKHLTLREELIELNTIYCSDSLVKIEDTIKGDRIQIIISKSEMNLSLHKLKYIELSPDDPKFIESVDGRPAYGLFTDEINVQAIIQLKVEIGDRKIIIPTEEYSNLFFPNFCNEFKSIKPLRAYKSKEEEFIYIYIFGNNGLEKNISSLKEVRSFLAKLVINVKTGYIGKFVLNNAELNVYQWDCTKFKGI